MDTRTGASRDKRWAALVATHRIFSASEAQRFGISPDSLRRRARSGGIQRIGSGWYAAAGVRLSWMHRLELAVRTSGGVASHRSAAVLWNLDGFRPSQPEVLVSYDSHPRAVGYRLHRTRSWEPALLSERHGVRAVGPALLAAQLASIVPATRLRASVDQLLRERHVSLAQLGDLAASQDCRSPGHARLEAVVGQYRGDDRVPASDFSRRVADLLVTAGLPEPALEHRFYDGEGLIQMVDLAYPDVLAIGLDSLAHHRDRDTFIRDRQARNRLELRGVRVLIFTWWDYRDEPDRLVAQVGRALRAAR